MPQADLEISLARRGTEGYGIELRFTGPTGEADQRHSGAQPVRFDLASLRKLELRPAGYGECLAGQLLAEPALRGFFDQAVAAAQAQEAGLRIRLALGPGAEELHSLRWETLRLPGADAPLLTGRNVFFSRYLSSLDWRPVRLRPTAALRGLIAIADPANAAEFQLTPIDAAPSSWHLPDGGWAPSPRTRWSSAGRLRSTPSPASSRDGYDILYLVAHGQLVDEEPYLFLDSPEGEGKWVAGRELVTRIQELHERPRLVVLASCRSGGAGTLAGIGPRLAAAGVPAVLAMQGDVTVETAENFVRVFFEELRRNSPVDQAAAVARGSVRENDDWWMPVLFMRLRSGRIGYNPGFSAAGETLETWPALLRSIERGRCTPILGPGLHEWLLGSAARHRGPLGRQIRLRHGSQRPRESAAGGAILENHPGGVLPAGRAGDELAGEDHRGLRRLAGRRPNRPADGGVGEGGCCPATVRCADADLPQPGPAPGADLHHHQPR